MIFFFLACPFCWRQPSCLFCLLPHHQHGGQMAIQQQGGASDWVQKPKQKERKARTCGGKAEVRKSARLYLVVVCTVDKDQPRVCHKLLGAAVAFISMGLQFSFHYWQVHRHLDQFLVFFRLLHWKTRQIEANWETYIKHIHMHFMSKLAQLINEI